MDERSGINQVIYVAIRLLLTVKDALPVLGLALIASVLWRLA